MILDVTATSVDLPSSVGDNNTYKPLEDEYKQKLSKYQPVADQNGLQLILAIFPHAGQMHDIVKRFIKDQIRLQVAFTRHFPVAFFGKLCKYRHARRYLTLTKATHQAN